MSMGANPSLMVDVMANTAMLGTGLAQAEAQVRQSTDRIGREIDSRMGKFGADITRKLTAAIGAGFAINALDQSIRAGIEAVKAGGTLNEAGIAVGEGLEKSIRSLPVVGAIGGAIADAFLFGLDSVLDIIPQWVKDLDRKIDASIPGGVIRRVLFPFLGGVISGAEDIRTEGRQAQSRQEAEQNQREMAMRRNQEISAELERLQSQQRGVSPIEEQLQRMAGGGVTNVETAIGSFRFGEADASAQLVKAAREQVEILQKIKDLQAELANNMKVAN
jgi:hypothetical protein